MTAKHYNDRCAAGLHLWPYNALRVKGVETKQCMLCVRFERWRKGSAHHGRVPAPYCSRGHDPAVVGNIVRREMKRPGRTPMVVLTCRACDKARSSTAALVSRTRAAGRLPPSDEALKLHADTIAYRLYARYVLPTAKAPTMPENTDDARRKEAVLDRVNHESQVLRYADSSLLFRMGVPVALERAGDLFVLHGSAGPVADCLRLLRRTYPRARIVRLLKPSDCMFAVAAFFGRTAFGDVRLRAMIEKYGVDTSVPARSALEPLENLKG